MDFLILMPAKSKEGSKKRGTEPCAVLSHRMSAGDVGRNVDPSEGEVAQRTGGAVLFLLEEDVTPPLVVLCASLRIANVPVLCIVLSMLLIDVIAIGLVVISVVHGTSLPVLNLHIPNIFFARQPTDYLQIARSPWV